MIKIVDDNFTSIYRYILDVVNSKGTLEGKTRDVLDLGFELTDINKSLLLYRKNWKWAFQEAFDRLSPLFNMPHNYMNPGFAYKYRPAWKRKLIKEEGTFDYSYGERFKDQLPIAIEQLRKQKTTREAIVSVWGESYLIHQDVFQRRPCTLTLHFLIRGKKLHLFVNMRTNDIINLLPYDVFHHSLLQKYVATKLGLGFGSYHHHADHAYYPKKRERPGRNYFPEMHDKLSMQLAKPIKYCGFKSEDIDRDFIAAYDLLAGNCDIRPDNSYINNMVNLLMGEELTHEFSHLNFR